MPFKFVAYCTILIKVKEKFSRLPTSEEPITITSLKIRFCAAPATKLNTLSAEAVKVSTMIELAVVSINKSPVALTYLSSEESNPATKALFNS
jgi:serine kinase of HPr protein (carbohydrate metabolism regulator)